MGLIGSLWETLRSILQGSLPGNGHSDAIAPPDNFDVRARARQVLAENPTILVDIPPELELLEQYNSWLAQHAPQLLLKKRQLVFVNDYGVEDASAYERELDYFVKTVVPQRFKASLTTNSLLQATRREVIWEDRRDRGRANRARRAGVVGADNDLANAYRPAMDGQMFERMIATIIKENGGSVRHTPPTGDQGVDLIAELDSIVVAIQCKRCQSAVGNAAVQEVSAGKIHYGADMAWVVTDASFTRAARQLAQTTGVELIHFQSLPARIAAVTGGPDRNF